MEEKQGVRAVRYQRPSHSQQTHQQRWSRKEYHIGAVIVLVTLAVVGSWIWGYSQGMEACYGQIMAQRMEVHYA